MELEEVLKRLKDDYFLDFDKPGYNDDLEALSIATDLVKEEIERRSIEKKSKEYHTKPLKTGKNRYAVTCNGRAAFYACMWDDIRKCSMDNGWAVALHGSLNSDMDIMAMPWVDNSVPFEELVKRISCLFSKNDITENYSITYDEKPHNRIVATIPIFADFYLDISTINV